MDREKINNFMIRNRTLVIGEEITGKLIDNLRSLIMSMLMESSKKDIFLFIDCGGGDVRAALAFYDFLKSLPCKIIGVVNGKCHSATIIVLAGCTERFSLKHSRFLFHRIRSAGSINDILDPVEAARISVEQHGKLCKDVYQVYQKEYGISEEKLKEISTVGEHYEKQLFTDEAINLKIIHKVIEKLPFEFSAK